MPRFLALAVERLDALGTRPLCNGRADRAPRVAGLCLPLCARCLGLVAGGILGQVPGVAVAVQGLGPIGIAGLLLWLPTDHFAGRFGILSGSNAIRFWTGVAFGVGVEAKEK